MAEPRRVLILGGTEQARALADALAAESGIAPVTALAGRTAEPRRPAGIVRIGGFGGVDGLVAALAEVRAAALVDATHPYAARISANAVTAAGRAAVPLLRLDRLAWTPVPGDRWTVVPDMASAARALPSSPATVFLTTGRQSLAAFATRPEHRYVVRVVDPPEAALPIDADVIVARGPFSQDAERRLLRERGIGLVVTKNAGGEATYAKIAAARALGLPVIVVDRPALPPAPTAGSVAEAAAWLRQRLRERS